MHWELMAWFPEFASHGSGLYLQLPASSGSTWMSQAPTCNLHNLANDTVVNYEFDQVLQLYVTVK